MPLFRCPTCNAVFSDRADSVGSSVRCVNCSNGFTLDIEHLAHFLLPMELEVQVRHSSGAAVPDCPVLISYGYDLPPLRTNSQGSISVLRQAFEKSQADEVSTGLMDHKGDYSLGRFVRIRVPSRQEAIRLSHGRRHSGWPILAFERELYRNLESLLMAYVPPLECPNTERELDLATVRPNQRITVQLQLPPSDAPLRPS